MLYNQAYQPDDLCESQLFMEEKAELFNYGDVYYTLLGDVNDESEDNDEWLGEPDYYQYEPDDDQWTLSYSDTDLFDDINW